MFYKRMVDLLKEILLRINVKTDMEVTYYEFYRDFERCYITPENQALNHSEIDAIKAMVDKRFPFMRNRNGYREVLCRVGQKHIERGMPNSVLSPLTMVHIRYPLNIYDSLSNYQLWSNIEEWNPVFRYHTLLDFTLIEFLSECRENFPNPNFELAIQRSGESYLSFMIPRMSEEYRANFINSRKDMEDMDRVRMIDAENGLLHSDLNLISFQRYEKQEIASVYTISSYEKIEKLPLQVRFQSPVPIREHKTIRKLLQIANANKHTLVGTVAHAFGFISIDHPDLRQANHSLQRPDFISIRFFGVSDWEVSKLHHGGRTPLMRSASFRYQYPKERYSEEHLKRTLSTLQDCDTEAIKKIVDTAINEVHGTMLVISEGAKQEAERLSECCIAIEPTPFHDINMNVTAIDGAVLCDPFGICYAIGLILDGVHEPGNGETISRGARHNSAKRYFNWQSEHKCVIVIVSEDRDVTVIPDK